MSSYKEEQLRNATSLTKYLELAKEITTIEVDTKKAVKLKEVTPVETFKGHEDLIMCLQPITKDKYDYYLPIYLSSIYDCHINV